MWMGSHILKKTDTYTAYGLLWWFILFSICCICNKPISVGQLQVIKGTKYFFGKCYRYTHCYKNLVGRTVFTKGSEMVCEVCATCGKTMACTICKRCIQPTEKYLGLDLVWKMLQLSPLWTLIGRWFMREIPCVWAAMINSALSGALCVTRWFLLKELNTRMSHITILANCEKQLTGILFITQPYCKLRHAANFAKYCVVCHEVNVLALLRAIIILTVSWLYRPDCAVQQSHLVSIRTHIQEISNF